MSSLPTAAAAELFEQPPEEGGYRYSVYGLRLRSGMRLTIPALPSDGPYDLELLPGDPDLFDRSLRHVTLDATDWHHHELPDGWSYVRYDELFDFLIAPAGDRILYRLLRPVATESFQTYALGRIFSFALVKMGQEPLHAATVVVNGQAVAFLGGSTFGKSTLAGCFVHAGYPLLTDDVLRLEQRGNRFLAFPGPPRLKLFPKVARLFLGDCAEGVAMNPTAAKLVYPLSLSQSFGEPVPMAAIYVVTSSRKVPRKQRITLDSLPPLEALLKILSFTHNHHLTNPRRLERQFAAAQRLLEAVPVRKLAYPRVLVSLPGVRDAILADLGRNTEC